MISLLDLLLLYVSDRGMVCEKLGGGAVRVAGVRARLRQRDGLEQFPIFHVAFEGGGQAPL